jgi:hypothetical protein
MLTIPGHKEKVNQTTLRSHLTPIRMAFIKNSNIKTNVGNDVWGKEPSCTDGGNVN